MSYTYAIFCYILRKSVICGSADYRVYGSFQRSEIPSDPSGFHYRIPFRSSCSSPIEHESEIARFAPLLQVEIGSSSVFGSSNFNLAPKSMRSPLPCRPDRTGTLIYLVSDRFITPTRVRVHPHE